MLARSVGSYPKPLAVILYRRPSSSLSPKGARAPDRLVGEPGARRPLRPLRDRLRRALLHLRRARRPRHFERLRQLLCRLQKGYPVPDRSWTFSQGFCTPTTAARRATRSPATPPTSGPASTSTPTPRRGPRRTPVIRVARQGDRSLSRLVGRYSTQSAVILSSRSLSPTIGRHPLHHHPQRSYCAP